MCPYQRLALCLATDRPWLGVGMVRPPLPHDSFLRYTPVVYPGASHVPHARDATGVGASCISGAAVLIRPTKNPRPAPAASQRPAPAPRLDPSARLTHNETSTEVYAIHPSGLPLARDPWMVQGSFDFPPDLRTPPLPATHAEGGPGHRS